MPDKIPAMSSTKFIRLLKRGGARFVRQRGTSHAIFRRIVRGEKYSAPVIMNKSELSPKYIRLVFRQLGFTNEEIEALLK